MKSLRKRIFVLFLCLSFFVTSFSVPEFAKAGSTANIDGTIQINAQNNICYIGDTIGIEVNDPNFNKSFEAPDTVTVKVSSTSQDGVSTLQSQDIVLQETEISSNKFVGFIKITAATGSAIVPNEILGENSGTITAKYIDGDINNGGIERTSSITISALMLEGAVSYPDPDSTPVSGGAIEVQRINNDNSWTNVGNYPIDPSGGTYRLPRLPEGKYSLCARQNSDPNYLGSKRLEINVASDGTCTNSENQVLHIVNFEIQRVQFGGSIKPKSVSDVLNNNEYYIEIRSMDPNIGHNFPKDWTAYDGTYKVAGIPTGNYAIKVVSRKAGSTDSFEVPFSIENGEVITSAPSFDLQLTEPQLTGVVNCSDGAVPYTNVDVFDSNGNYMWSNQTDASGAFSIGGLKPGSYKISANNQGKPGYMPTNKVEFKIDDSYKSDTTNLELLLEKKELKLKWVGAFVLNYSEIGIHLDNTSLLNNNWSGLTATITGNGLTNAIVLGNARRGMTWGEEGEFYFPISNDIRNMLTFGRYSVEIKNNGVSLPYDLNKNQLDIIQQLSSIPRTIELSQYQGAVTELNLNVEAVNNVRLYPWKAGDKLTVKITKADGEQSEENTVDVTVPTNMVLQLYLPVHTGAVAGRRDINVYNGEQLVARGSFDVGVSTIGKVTANESSQEAVLQGEYLGSYPENLTRAELWQNNVKLADSKYTNVGEDVRFQFDYIFKAGTTYTLKVFINGVVKQLPNGGIFEAVPHLNWSNPDFTLNTNKQFTIEESSIQGYGWSSGDNISVKLSGPGAWDYFENKGANLQVSDNNLVFTVTNGNGQGRNYPLPSGEFYLEVFKDNALIGFTDVIIAYSTKDVLCGTVKTSDNQNVDGGYINIGKDGEGWGERITVGHDGSFYAFRNKLRGNGRYFLTAVPATSEYASNSVFIDIVNEDFSSPVNITLNTVQVTGTVRAEGIAVNGGTVDVMDPSSGQWIKVQSAPINPDGSYKIGGLENGKLYYLKAHGPWDKNYLSSDKKEITYKGSPLTDVSLDLSLPQITGTAKDGNGINLFGGQYKIDVRAIGNNKNGSESRTNNESFYIGHLEPGAYAIAITPNGLSPFARSYETIVIVDQNGIATPNTLNLTLSQPMLIGSVYNKGGELVTEDGYVEVWNYQTDGQGYIYSIPLTQGTFKVGGLPAGAYMIRAAASDYTQVTETNSPSMFVKVTLSNETIASQNLTLTDRAIPRILWVNDAQIGNNRLTAHILNYRQLDVSKMEAEIVKADGSSLSPALYISHDKIRIGWNDFNRDEADLELYIDDGLQAEYGKYLLNLTYNGDSVVSDPVNVNAFDIYYTLNIQPRGVLPETTKGMTLQMYVDDQNGGPITNLWDSNTILSVRLLASDGKKYSDLAYTKNADGTLTVTLPNELEGDKLSDGWAAIELYRNGQLLADGGILVGVPVIDRVEDANEGDDIVNIRGDYLAYYENPQTTATILDSNGVIKWESKEIYFRDDRLEVHLKDIQLPAGRYKLKLTSVDVQDKILSFAVAPPLICQPHAIATGQSAQLIVKNSSAWDTFKWDQSDLINNFMVRVSGPANWYDITSDNGLSFDTDHNLIVAISGDDGASVLSQTGEGWLEVFKSDQKIGYSRFTIGQDAISATVKDPDGNVVPNAKVRITNLNKDDYNSRDAFTDSEGKLYIAKKDLPRKDDASFNGDYSFLVMAPEGANYTTSLFTKTINADINNEFDLQMVQPQIAGVVKEGSLKAKGGVIEVNKVENNQWNHLFDFDLNSDGIFRIGGLQDGTYFIRAHEDDNNKNYVSSDAKTVIVSGTVVSDITLSLNPVQISGDALNPNDEQLQAEQYHVNVQPLDQVNKEVRGEDRTDDGYYRIGALKPGRYAISLRPNRNTPYTQSSVTIITVNTDGTVQGDGLPLNLPLKLTNAKLSGTVTLKGTASAGSQSFNEGYVDVFTGTWQRPMYVTTVELDDNGSFRIGGIPDGDYYIRAAIWKDSPLAQTYSQSVMTEITVGTTPTVQLTLLDKTPRIRYVDNVGIGDDRINVHIVNRSRIQDISLLSARIYDASGNPVSNLITGMGQFFYDGEYDDDKDEGNLCIRFDQGIQYPVGKYTLKLYYGMEELMNETPVIANFNGFHILYNLDIRPFTAVPEGTAGKVIKLGLDMDKAQYPWSASDTVVVRMYKEDGSYLSLEKSIAEDKTMTVTLPDTGLDRGTYTMVVYVNGQLIARNDFIVGYPKVEVIDDITEEQKDFRIRGQNLNIYMDETTKVEIYDSTGKLQTTVTDLQFMYGDIVINLNDMTLAPGEYTLRLYYKNGIEASPADGWKFKSVDILKATPENLLTNQTTGKQVILEKADGSIAPWNAGDTLRICLSPDEFNQKGAYVFEPASDDVTNNSVSFTIGVNFNWVGRCSMSINKVDENGNETYVGYAHFYLYNKGQISGTILDPSNKAVPYSYVYLKKKNDESWYTRFDADVNGKFTIYDVEQGDYTAYAAPAEGLSFMDSDGLDITIDSDGNCSSPTHDFNLKPGRRISGTISLPEGVNAPAEGFKGRIAAWNDMNTPENKEDDIFIEREFKFLGGANTTKYSIIVPEGNIAYYVQAWGDGLGLVNSGALYHSSGSVKTLAEAEMVSVAIGDKGNINLSLIQGNAISGTVRLPSGKAPAGGIDVFVSVNDDKGNDNYKDDINGGIQVRIPENESRVNYTIFVPASSNYKVEYKADPKYLYYENGFYKSGSDTTYNRNQAANVDGTSNQAGIDLTLISAKFLKGTISIPQGYTIPAGGISGWVGAKAGSDEANDHMYGTDFMIESTASNTSTNYTIMVPAVLDNFTVQAWAKGPGLVSCSTFYKEGGSSVFDPMSATKITFASGVKEGVNITLAKGNIISGDVKLPAAAPAGGQIFIIQAINNNKDPEIKDDDIIAEYIVMIPGGQTTGHYELCMPAGTGYKVKYICDPSYQYMGEGYYSTGGTVINDDSASVVDITSAGQSSINLNVIEARIIKGSIIVPAGYVIPEEGISGWIGAGTGSTTESEADDQYFGHGFYIKKGYSSYVYTIAVPKDKNDFVVVLGGDGKGLVDCDTYYSLNGNAFTKSAASIITLIDNKEKTGIDITLVKGNSITGTITLPSAAPEGGRGMSVQAIINNGTDSKLDDIVAEAKVLVPAGQTSATYAIDVPAMDGYKVRYVSDPVDGYEYNGFYSTQGTVYYFEQGTTVNASNPVSGINLTVSNISKPVCNKAEVSADGTSLQLSFNKFLDKNTLPLNPTGFSLMVGQTSYILDGITSNERGTVLTLHIKDYKIFKDYKDIKIIYNGSAGIKAYDKMNLDGFEMTVANTSANQYSLITGFASGALLNKNAVINVATSGSAIVIKDNDKIISTTTGTASIEIKEEGSHEVVISVAGRMLDTKLNFTIDGTPPVVTIISPTNETVLKNNHDGITPTITFSQDCIPSTKTIILNGSTLSTNLEGLTYTGTTIREPGHYVLTATAKDAAGNVRTVSNTFDIVWDNSSPVITVNGVANGGIYENPTISVSLAPDANTTADLSNQANYSYKASLRWPDGIVTEHTESNKIPILNKQGAYRLEVVAKNPGYTDKTSSKVVEFVIDNSAPVTDIGGVINNAVYNYAVTPIISFSDSEKVASQQVLLNNAVITLTRDGAKVAYNIGDTISLDGVYVLTASTKDAMNHASNKVTRSFTIDTTKPVVSISGALNGATFKDQNVSLTFKTNEGNLTVKDDLGQVTLNGSGQHTFTGTADQIVNYKVVAKAVDAAGNSFEQQLSFSIDRLAVNIIVNGVTEGMTVNTSPDISFTTFDGTTEKKGTTVTIDNVAFTGGSYSVEGVHTLIAKYVSGETTYTKTLHFTIDNTKPAVSVSSVLKNGTIPSGNLIAKANDTITVRAKVSDAGGVGDVILNIGTANVLMNYVAAGDYYEGSFKVESGSFDSIAITVSAKDKAGNSASESYSKKLTIDNTKPLVSLETNPAVADGYYGIYKNPDMKITLKAGANDTIYWYLNGSSGSATGSKELTPAQGTNVLVYHAEDLAGNVSDEKGFLFEFDSIRPANVTLPSLDTVTTSMEYYKISGTVDGEGSKYGTMVLLKKSGVIIAKVNVKANDAFDFDGIKLAEGLNSFTVIAVDRAGNESEKAIILTRILDSTAPILNVEKVDDTHYRITSNEDIAKPIVKFNGVVVAEGNIAAVPNEPNKFQVTTPDPVEGTDVLNVTAIDTAGNVGTGSFTSTYIPPHTTQNDLPLNDNASMDIPNTAFSTNTQIFVKTVDVDGITNFKPLGAAISFEFKDDQGTPIEPTAPLLIKNYIGVGLSGVVLMHVNAKGVIDTNLTAKVIKSTDTGYQTKIDNMLEDDPYYVSDTGYLIFKTRKFSSYQVAQDNVAPVLTVTTANFIINKADMLAGGMKLAGEITDSDPNVIISEVKVDGVAMDISGITYNRPEESFSIPLNLTDGTHEVTVKASDAAGNTTTIIKTYQVDITEPTLTATPAYTSTNRDAVDISVNTGESAEIFINGVSKGKINGESIITFELTNNAENTIKVTATDAAGNTTEADTIKVTRDSSAPNITIEGVSNGDVSGGNVNIKVIITDPNTPTKDITMDGSAYTPGVFTTEGQHTLVVSSTDSFGNTASKTVVFTIDKSVPAINMTGAENGGIYDVDKTLNISANNVNELIITKATDNQAPVNINVPVDGTSVNTTLSLGTSGEQHSYNIVITAKKTVNGQLRWANTTINFTVDKKDPVITSTTSTQTENASIDLTGTIDEVADIYLNNTLVISDNPAGRFSITGQGLKLGVNSFQVKAVDQVGREAVLTIDVTRKEIVNNGGGNQGGYPGGNQGGYVPSGGNNDKEVKQEEPKATDTSEANAETGKPEPILAKPVMKGSKATATTTAEELSTAITNAVKDTAGEKTVKIELQEVKGAKTYTEVLPVNVMKTGGESLNVQIVSPLGTVTVPGDMFTSKDIDQKSNVGISIGVADKSKLEEATLKAIGNKPVIEISAAVDGKAITWSNPSAPVTIAIPYQPSASELKNPDHIVVWYIDGKGKVHTVTSGKYDEKTGTVTFTTTHFSKYAVAYVKKSFKDITKLAAKADIEVIAAKGIMNGKTNTAFDPESKVTRGDFIAYLVKTLSLTAEVKTNFADIKTSDPNYNAIGVAMKLEIISGTSKSKFHPDQLITKEEMAIYTVRAMKLSQKSLVLATRKDLSKYNDASDISSRAVGSIATLVKSGILKINGKQINSRGNLTRAEIAEILYHIYKAE